MCLTQLPSSVQSRESDSLGDEFGLWDSTYGVMIGGRELYRREAGAVTIQCSGIGAKLYLYDLWLWDIHLAGWKCGAKRCLGVGGRSFDRASWPRFKQSFAWLANWGTCFYIVSMQRCYAARTLHTSMHRLLSERILLQKCNHKNVSLSKCPIAIPPLQPVKSANYSIVIVTGKDDSV